MAVATCRADWVEEGAAATSSASVYVPQRELLGGGYQGPLALQALAGRVPTGGSSKGLNRKGAIIHHNLWGRS